MKALCLLAVALALVAAQPQAKPQDKPQDKPLDKPLPPKGEAGQPLRGESHGDAVPLWKLNEEQLRFRPSQPIRGSVLTSTKLVMDGMLAREPATASVHFAPFTTIFYRSILPNGGIYKGWLGLMDFVSRAKLTFNADKFSYTIPFVDEARGVSIIRCKYAGKFVRSGQTLEGTSTIYLKWRFGKISKIYVVDDDQEAVINAYQTNAEKVVSEFYSSLYECGDCASKFLADNIKTTVRMFPKSLGEKLSYEGLEAFRKNVGSVEAAAMLNSVQGVRYLYGSNDTVVALVKLGSGSSATNIASGLGVRGRGLDTTSMSGASVSDTAALRDLSGVTIFKVKDNKIVSSNSQISQPLLPWHMRQLGMFAMKKKQEAKVTGTVGDEKKQEKKN
jgi:hypothetical protein